MKKIPTQKAGEGMFDMYTAVVLITVLLLSITAADILTSRLITTETKQRSVLVCLLIAGAALSEWIGVVTNGAPPAWLLLHKCAKMTEFCLTPAVAVAVATAYGESRHSKHAVAIVIVHAVFECIALFPGWVFRIDAENVYHRGGLYWVYISVFSAAVLYGFFCIAQGSQKYQASFDCTMGLTLLMLVTGITIQMFRSDIRIVFLCVAISNTLLYNRYCSITLQVDAVTHLLNRRCYENSLGNMESKAILLFFDINRFKQVNDTYGHYVGDICLRNVAAQLRKVYGKHGSCYRIGGDEFCVILNRNPEQLNMLNRKFREAIEAVRTQDPRMPDVAIGYAHYSAGTSHIQDVIEEADAMMYQNKATG